MIFPGHQAINIGCWGCEWDVLNQMAHSCMDLMKKTNVHTTDFNTGQYGRGTSHYTTHQMHILKQNDYYRRKS